MLHYKYMTFCEFKECKKFKDCHRAYTDTVKDKAIKSGLPVARFGSKPECYEVNDGTNI